MRCASAVRVFRLRTPWLPRDAAAYCDDAVAATGISLRLLAGTWSRDDGTARGDPATRTTHNAPGESPGARCEVRALRGPCVALCTRANQPEGVPISLR